MSDEVREEIPAGHPVNLFVRLTDSRVHLLVRSSQLQEDVAVRIGIKRCQCPSLSGALCL